MSVVSGRFAWEDVQKFFNSTSTAYALGHNIKFIPFFHSVSQRPSIGEHIVARFVTFFTSASQKIYEKKEQVCVWTKGEKDCIVHTKSQFKWMKVNWKLLIKVEQWMLAQKKKQLKYCAKSTRKNWNGFLNEKLTQPQRICYISSSENEWKAKTKIIKEKAKTKEKAEKRKKKKICKTWKPNDTHVFCFA